MKNPLVGDDYYISSSERKSEYDVPSEEENRLGSYSKLLSTFTTACSNFSVQYNFQSVSIALLIMSASQCTIDDDGCKEGEQASWVFSTASASVFVGAIMGQLTMGYAGDILGRNAAMIMTLGLVAVAALLSALAPTGPPTQVYSTIIITRFFLGIGVGGVYPLSATKAAEDNSAGGGGHGSEDVNISAAAFAFFWQVPGSMAPWILANIFASSGNVSDETQWRLLLGLGAVPAILVVLCTVAEMKFRTKQATLETTRLTLGSQQRSSYAASSENSGMLPRSTTLTGDGSRASTVEKKEVDIWPLLKKADTWKKLLATGGGWLIYDIAYYGVSLFAGEIISAFSDTDDDSVSSDKAIKHVTSQNLIGLSMGIPACLLSMYCLKFMTSKTLQIIGFILIAFFFILLAVCFVPLRDDKEYNDVLFVLYCLLLFSLCFGPNVTTFILPAQTYPKNIRATFNGISAACGKVGAFAGVYMYGSIADATSYPTVMVVSAIFSLIGAVISYYFIDIAPLARDSHSMPLLSEEEKKKRLDDEEQ